MADLYSIPVEALAGAQQRALLRLHLKVSGDTHRILSAYLTNLKREIEAAADTETGTLDPIATDRLVEANAELWADALAQWLRLFRAARRVAVWLPCGQLARLHEHYFDQFTLSERRRLEEQAPAPLQVGELPDAEG